VQKEIWQKAPSSIFMNGTFGVNYDRQMKMIRRAVSKTDAAFARTQVVTSLDHEKRKKSIEKIEESPKEIIFFGRGDY